MSAGTIRALAKHRELIEKFKEDPWGALNEIEAKSGETFPNLNIADIKMLQSMTIEEFELFLTLHDKAQNFGVKQLRVF